MQRVLDNEKPLIITGMHRSGTSLLARFIYYSGIDLGSTLLGVRKSNRFGHYEDVEILNFHRSILLREFGHQMWVPGPPRTDSLDLSRATKLITARQKKPLWGWKEPRTCLFLDFWSSIIPKAQYLLLVRHPLAVLDSLSRRTNTRPFLFWRHNTFLSAWHVYNQECLRFIQRNYPRCTTIILEKALDAPDRLIRILSQRYKYNFSLDDFHGLYDASAITRMAELRRLTSPSLRSKCLGLYTKLDSLCSMPS